MYLVFRKNYTMFIQIVRMPNAKHFHYHIALLTFYGSLDDKHASRL
jgi:hypothetical protein